MLGSVVSGGPGSADVSLLAYRYVSLRTGGSNQNQCGERGYAGDDARSQEGCLEAFLHAFGGLAGALTDAGG